MSDVTVEQYRDALRAIGDRPLGSVQYKNSPDVFYPQWSFYWQGPGSLDSMMADVFVLLERMGIERWDRQPLDVTDFIHVVRYLWPIRDLNGELCEELKQTMRLSYAPTDGETTSAAGHRYSVVLHVNFDFHWLAPLNSGPLHDNREWSRINRPFLREFFIGLADLGFVYVPYLEDTQISPLDAFGFVDVDVDGLKEQTAKSWRALVEGEITRDQFFELPAIPTNEPIDWRVSGFDWTEDELFGLYEGITGGEEAIRRALPWFSAIKAPQVVGDRDELVTIATELKDQLVASLTGVDKDLANKYRSFPVLMEYEVPEEERKNKDGYGQRAFRGLDDKLFAHAPIPQSDVIAHHMRTVHSSFRGPHSLLQIQFAAPLRGMDFDLSAAVSLWANSGQLRVTDNAFLVQLSSHYWVHTSSLAKRSGLTTEP